jgi:hypothetical protein
MTDEEMDLRLNAIAQLLGISVAPETNDIFVRHVGELFDDLEALKPRWEDRYKLLKDQDRIDRSRLPHGD